MQPVGWHIEMEFDEDESHTRAAVLLRLPDGTELRSRGRASRDPHDPNEPRIGEELAGSRALMDLADQLMAKARGEVRELSGQV